MVDPTDESGGETPAELIDRSISRITAHRQRTGSHARKREERTAGRPGRCVPRSKSGDVLLSQGITPQVPSALTGLTSVFGMGTGVTLSLWSPKSVVNEGSPQGLQSKHELFKTKPSAD